MSDPLGIEDDHSNEPAKPPRESAAGKTFRNEKFHFKLWQIHFLMLLLGILFACLRSILLRQNGSWFSVVITIYLGLFVTYFVLRLPFICIQIVLKLRESRARKQKTLDFAEQLRQVKRGSQEGGDGSD